MFKNYLIIRYRDQIVNRLFYLVDPEFLDIFNFPLIEGDARSALREPGSILISQRMARRFLGEDDPVGQIIAINANEVVVVLNSIAYLKKKGDRCITNPVASICNLLWH